MYVKVLNDDGQQVFFGAEESSGWTRNCCGAMRNFDLILVNGQAEEVARFKRPFHCTCRWFHLCWSPCALQEMDIEVQGELIGRIEQKWSCLDPIYNIYDAEGGLVLRIKGPICALSCANDINYEVSNLITMGVGLMATGSIPVLGNLFSCVY